MLRLLMSIVCLLACLAPSALARVAGPVEGWQRVGESRDLADIRRTGQLRVLVNQSRHSSGVIKDEVVGVEYIRLRAFVRYLNRGGGESITLKLIPKPKDQLLGALQRGEGDLVAPGELLEARGLSGIVRSRAVQRAVPMVLVTRQGSRVYRRFDELSGRALVLASGSAARGELTRINQALLARGQAPIALEWVDASLAIEDVLELVHAGVYPATLVELPIAERWAKVLPRLRIDRSMQLGEARDANWFFRADAKTLQARADRFLAEYRPPADQDAAFLRHYRRLSKVQYPLDRLGRQRLEKVRPTLQHHAQNLEFDWLDLAAIAFKESTLNPSAVSPAGAIGLMQVIPATARGMGVGDPRNLDSNVLASARYLSSLRRDHFASPRLNERERMAFMLAAYNMGPQRVQTLRAEARRRGLNPDQWFFQVERVALEQMGLSGASYVSSINKYYVAYARERYLLENPANPQAGR